MDADPDANCIGRLAFCSSGEIPLHRDTALNGLVGTRERDHETVALALDHMAAVIGDELAHHLVMLIEKPGPGAVTHPLVERCRLFDVREHDDDVPARCHS